MANIVTALIDCLMQININRNIVTPGLGLDPRFVYQMPAYGNQQGSGTSWTNSGTIGTQSPPVSEAWEGIVTLSAGAATIDLTALVTTGLANINATGLHLIAMKLQAGFTNTNPVTVKTGVTNGYTGIGAGIPLKNPGDEAQAKYLNGIAIDGTHKTIDFVGTGADSVNVILVFG